MNILKKSIESLYKNLFFHFNLNLKYDLVFIVDEVQTGLGATGKLWAHERNFLLIILNKKSYF